MVLSSVSRFWLTRLKTTVEILQGVSGRRDSRSWMQMPLPSTLASKAPPPPRLRQLISIGLKVQRS